jgi:hypothetical protein
MVLAPGLQPDDTGAATTGDQAGDMASSPVRKSTGSDTSVAESSAAFKPGRQVGWIFKNGEVVAIERQECESRKDEDAP